MSEVLKHNPNLGLAADYISAVADVCADPSDELAYRRLLRLDDQVADVFMQYPVTPWNMSRGHSPVTLSDGIAEVRAKVLREHRDVEAAMARQSRATLISLGARIPVSGGLVPPEFPQAYEHMEHTLDRIGGQERSFTQFAFHRIKRDLYREYTYSRSGYNLTQLDNDTLEGNIKSALDCIGYPFGPVGRLIITSMGILPRQQRR